MWTAPQLEARREEIARHQHDGSLRSALLERLNSLLPQRAVSINEFNATKRLIVHPGSEPFVYDQKLTPYDRAITDACDHRSDEHPSELQPLIPISYALFCFHTQT